MAFIRRDFRIESSYKLAFLLETVGALITVLSFHFVGKLVDSGRPASLAKYGGGYFGFAMVGLAMSQYFVLSLQSFSGAIRRSQMAGCLEAMLSTRTSPGTVVVLSALYSFLTKTVHIGLVFLVAWLGLGVRFSSANVPAALGVLALSVLAFGGLGILAAAALVVLKKGDPIGWAFSSLSSLVAGALFPVEILPGWLRTCSQLVPMTHSLEAMRLALFKGASLADLRGSLLKLGIMAAVLLPAGIWAFSKAVDKGRRDGSLLHY